MLWAWFRLKGDKVRSHYGNRGPCFSLLGGMVEALAN